MILFISLIFVGHISNDESLYLDAAGNNLSISNPITDQLYINVFLCR